MCRRTTCKKCGRPSWAGCGAHVDQVLRDVPPAERCRCNARSGVSGSKRTTPKKERVATATTPAEDAPKRRWFRR